MACGLMACMLFFVSWGINSVFCEISGGKASFGKITANNPFLGPKGEKIVGGDDCSIRERPFYAEIKLTDPKFFPHLCGSTLMSERWILTAAHCNIHDIGIYLVVAGLTFSDFIDPYTTQTSSLESFVNHPKYSEGTDGKLYDVAVAKLKTPMVETRWVQFAKILERSPIALKEKCKETGVAIGFGVQGNKLILLDAADAVFQIDFKNKKYNSHLQCVKLKILPQEKCGEYGGGDICAYTEYKGVCSGDSGGPFMCGDTLIGVSARTAGCAARWNAATFIRISKILDFIDTWVHETPHLKIKETSEVIVVTVSPGIITNTRKDPKSSLSYPTINIPSSKTLELAYIVISYCTFKVL